ncbi:DUF1569 domain-containing protein [Robiginitalea sp. M366]|uniref:DUF1569 domain-containing protein n=1 Tax=Robiginitalea aestuariiviva TaxID=3036903 RepID=UPI00240E5AEC|nr:DUF1569 domain-containing protein [Robiginitalea aestuariiviva]MDG1572080.1 DUF1569 domain-containing protein [Robiginitalea aestuariiviva]
MKSLFEPQAYSEICDRLSRLEAGSKPLWGRMTAGQMVWHCQIPLKVAIENRDKDVRSNPLIRWLFKKSLYNDRPWRKNLPTAPAAKAVEPKDFETEAPKLLELVQQFHALSDRSHWNPHPLFGAFTHQQWGQLEYKHLDHHLKQFGV